MKQPVEQPEITPAMVAAWQRQQAEREEQERRALVADLQTLAQQRGYTIVAMPMLRQTNAGFTLTADWGVAKAE